MSVWNTRSMCYIHNNVAVWNIKSTSYTYNNICVEYKVHVLHRQQSLLHSFPSTLFNPKSIEWIANCIWGSTTTTVAEGNGGKVQSKVVKNYDCRYAECVGSQKIYPCWCLHLHEPLIYLPAWGPLSFPCGPLTPILDLCGPFTPILDLCGPLTPILDLCGPLTPILDLCGPFTPILDLCGPFTPILDLCGPMTPILDLSLPYAAVSPPWGPQSEGSGMVRSDVYHVCSLFVTWRCSVHNTHSLH